jgi:hypothetical protein
MATTAAAARGRKGATYESMIAEKEKHREDRYNKFLAQSAQEKKEEEEYQKQKALEAAEKDIFRTVPGKKYSWWGGAKKSKKQYKKKMGTRKHQKRRKSSHR